MEKNEKCPFCKSEELEDHTFALKGKEKRTLKQLFWISCGDCGANGPQATSVELAWEKWNDRL